MFLKHIIKKRRWRYPLNTLIFLIVVGTLANYTPWVRGWFSDLRWIAGNIVKMNQQGIPLSDYSMYLERMSLDESTPEGGELKKRFDIWYSSVTKLYPDFQVNYKNVPDDQNGFLKILEWQDERKDEKNDPNLTKLQLPSQFQDALDLKIKNIPSNTLIEIENYLKFQQRSIARAMAIGQMPEQSCSGISSSQRYPLVSLAKEIANHLSLKALVEASRGDSAAALKTMQALQGWGNHYIHIETPTMLDSTLATAIDRKMQGIVYLKILPLISKNEFDYVQWSELFIDKLNIEQRWFHMLKGEWHFIIHKTLPATPGDPITFLDTFTTDWHYRAGPNGIYDSEEAIKAKSTSLMHLSVGNRALHEALFLGISSYRSGYLKSQALLQQYEVAFTLKKFEAEGRKLDELDQEIIKTLPLKVTPDIRLSIDFDKRLISVSDPKKIISSIEALEF